MNLLEVLPALLIGVTFALSIMLSRRTLAPGILRVLIMAIPCIYLTPAFLLACGFRLSDSFDTLRLHDTDTYLLALKLCSLVLLTMLFCVAGTRLHRPKVGNLGRPRNGVRIAGLFVVIGFLALHLYASEIGGYFELFATVLIYKSGVEPVYTSLSFLKTLSTISSAAYFVFVDLAIRRRSGALAITGLICFIVGASGLYIQGGRLSLLIYIIPLYGILPRVIKVGILFAAPFAGLMLLHPERVLFSPDREAELSYFEVIRTIISDFFPATGNVYWLQLDAISSWRWFKDVPSVVFAFLPKRVLDLGDYEGESTAIFKLVGFPNAADLIGFGILSASIFGVAIWSFVYGYILSIAAGAIKTLAASGFKVSAIGLTVYFLFRPMYFSPQHFVFTFLPYIYLLLLVRELRGKSEPIGMARDELKTIQATP
jgi:hypothetical protein